MLTNLLSFLEDTTTDTNSNGWITYVVLGVLLVAMVLLTVIPQKKQKKKAEEMMSQLGVGREIITIGGVVGTVVQLDDQYVWIETGTDVDKQTLKFLRQAIHSVVPDGADAAQSLNAKDSKKDDKKDDNNEIV